MNRIPLIASALVGLLATPAILHGQSAAVQRNCPQAVQGARAAVQETPFDPRLELSLARALTGCRQYVEAESWYRQYLQSAPEEAGVWYELGETFAHAHQYGDATLALRQALQLDPRSTAAEIGLAQADAAQEGYPEALRLYDDVLRKSPASYDALQGKSFVLYWTHRFSEAQAIFQRLAELDPRDPENSQALAQIGRAMDERQWTVWRPPEGSLAQAFVGYYMSYLADHPSDRLALLSLAEWQSRWGDLAGAARTYGRLIRLNPGDRNANAQLAKVLAWQGHYDASITILQRLLAENSSDLALTQELATVYTWSGRPEDALRAQQRLVAFEPGNAEPQIAVARLEIDLHEDHDASESLREVLRQQPQNQWARIQLARLEVRNGHLREALRNYDVALGNNFEDAEALYGEAQIYYYVGDPDRAYPFAKHLINERPKDFDVLMLMARIERARRHGQAALAYLNRATAVNPANPEVAALHREIAASRAVTLHTASSYARELSLRNPSFTPAGVPLPGRELEDLNASNAAMTLDFSWLRLGPSYVSLSTMPSTSPAGGIQGAVAPADFLYGQTARVSNYLTLRGGAGMVRMGPGELFAVANQTAPVESVGIAAIGFGGFSFRPAPKLTLDVTLSRLPVTWSPAAVRFGVMDTRLDATVTARLDARTGLTLSYYHDALSSAVYDQAGNAPDGATLLEKNGRDSGNGASLVLSRNLIQFERFAVDAGYSGTVFGYAGARRGIFMGFFNPTLYQDHMATSHIYGHLWGPVSYTAAGDIGIQQVDESQPFTRALRLGSGLTFRLSRRASLTLGYLHYDFAQPLGPLKGNAVELSTDWRF